MGSFTDEETSTVYTDRGNGQFETADGATIQPGWKIDVGFANFARAFTDEEIRRPLIGVVIWTFAFAILSVASTFALPAIPDEIVEAAKVDGAKPWALFRYITLPLLMVSLAPLLISSFAFNFNNFNLIYMLTGGGPRDISADVNVGVTDILITLVYKVAFGSVAGRDYGLASALGVNTYLMYGFFNTVPVSIDEAAKTDGASHARIFFTIILRLVAPILAIVGLLSFIGTTNEFVIASVLLSDPNKQTLAVGLYQFVSDETSKNWSLFAAGAVMALFLYLQKYIVNGLTAGAVK